MPADSATAHSDHSDGASHSEEGEYSDGEGASSMVVDPHRMVIRDCGGLVVFDYHQNW